MIARALLALAVTLSTAAHAAPPKPNVVARFTMPSDVQPQASMTMALTTDKTNACDQVVGQNSREAAVTVTSKGKAIGFYMGCWRLDGDHVAYYGFSESDPQPLRVWVPTKKFQTRDDFVSWKLD